MVKKVQDGDGRIKKRAGKLGYPPVMRDDLQQLRQAVDV